MAVGAHAAGGACVLEDTPACWKLQPTRNCGDSVICLCRVAISPANAIVPVGVHVMMGACRIDLCASGWFALFYPVFDAS